ncbi:Terpene synthase, metal-binding domain-containing protein [Cynara cardunculus var. scolymus]|uniref:Terpene synthase, metal-binding domain-containing protein n=2 Tax=Cynara cardunculus var. scolymus TaxID=59895 RepID=A0A103XTI4_CYNCS|nr:Terpene synthase, metal-binding domain-containing protein [Cynara cardunculus var. scolymus]
MSSPFYINSLSKTSGAFSSNPQHPWRLVSSSPCKTSRVCRFKISLPVLPLATIAMPLTHCKPKAISSEVDVGSRMDELHEKTTRALMTASNPRMTMKLFDTIQRLGIGYSFDEEFIHKLIDPVEGQLDDDLYTVALRFRLQRTNGLHTNSDVFGPFLDANGKFKESSINDTEALLSLYEASYLGANGEDVLSQAKEFTTIHLKKSVSQLTPKLRKRVLHSLELPRHLRMDRLESRRYIEEYENESDHIPILLELAKLEYNQVQSLHQMELAEITRWWRHLGLVTKLTFARDRPLECFLWSVGLLPESKYSANRIELAKTISILLVIDDIFDTYGSYDDLVLFTKAIQRWDLKEMEQLPEYMKICYMALYNTTNEICYEVLKEHGLSVLPFLRKTWINMVEAFMVEVEWKKGRTAPNLKDYIENGVTTAGTYMALV